MTSAEGALAVGMVLKISTRSLPPSAMYKRFPSDMAKRGKLSVRLHMAGKIGLPLESAPTEAQRSELSLKIDVVKSFWPISTSAAWSIWVGIFFQISTRLNPRSVTIRRVPSLVTDTGLSSVFAAAVRELLVRSRFGEVVKFGSPNTRSAG